MRSVSSAFQFFDLVRILQAKAIHIAAVVLWVIQELFKYEIKDGPGFS
jgi:hypothetical protein